MISQKINLVHKYVAFTLLYFSYQFSSDIHYAQTLLLERCRDRADGRALLGRAILDLSFIVIFVRLAVCLYMETIAGCTVTLSHCQLSW